MAEQESINRWLIVGLCGVVLAVGLWFALAPGTQGEAVNDENTHDSKNAAGDTDPSDAAGPAVDPNLPRPDHRISESGRLTIEASSFGDAEKVNLALDLAKDARGDAALSVRVVAVDGRVLDTTASARREGDDGVQIAINSSWLQPGRYMIQIKTAEKTALPLRRYVLEVQ